nr:hypothetical protein [Tanacetum cinerariifolium]
MLQVILTASDEDSTILVRSFDQKKNNIQAQQKKKMVKTSSSLKNEACCSKSCKKNTDSLNSKITELTDKLGDIENMLFHYKLALAQVEARLAEHRNQKVKYCEKIRVLKFKTESRANCIESLTNELELIKKEKEGLDSKLIGFQTASKDLDNLLESQKLDKNKEGLGYSAVPPPTQVYSPPKKDLSWTGLPEFADDTVTDYSRPSPTTKTDRPTEDKTDKIKTAKKPAISYVEQYRKPSKKSTRKSRTKENYTHKSMPPRDDFHKTGRSPTRTTRPNMNAAPRPHVNNARPQTTQDLMIILIQRVKRLERELKATTLHTKIHKVDRGRSRRSRTQAVSATTFVISRYLASTLVHVKETLVKSPSFALGVCNLVFIWAICDLGYGVFGYEFTELSLKEEMHEMRKNYNKFEGDHVSKNDDTQMCERHEANYIQSEGYENQNSYDSFSHQSHHDPNDFEKSLTELKNDVRNDLEHFKRCICNMRTVHDKLFDRDNQSKTDLEKSITKFLDDQRVSNMFVKNNVNDMILKMKQNEKNFQTIFKNMERKINEWLKS